MSYFTANDGTKLFYQETGTGPDLVLVHGFGCTSQYFQKNVPVLSQHFHVVVPDLRGHGKSNIVKSGARLSRLAADVHELIQYLDLHNVTLLGWSMGVSVTWSYWDLFHGDRLAKFVFVDEPAADLETETQHTAGPTYNEMMQFSNALKTDFKPQMDQFVSRLMTDKNLDVSDLITDSQQSNPEFLSALFINNVMNDWSDTIPTITLPSLVFCGKKSFLSWRLVEQVADMLPDSQFELFENVGHMLFYEEEARFDQTLITFVEK